MSALILVLFGGQLSGQYYESAGGTFVMSTYLSDDSGELTSADILLRRDDFTAPTGRKIEGGGSVIWLRTEIYNEENEIHPQSLLYFLAVDSVEVYSLTAEDSLDFEYAARIHDYEPEAGFGAIYSLGVAPGSQRTIYSRLTVLEPATDRDLARILVADHEDLSWIFYSFWNAFYTGLVLCMGVLGLLMVYLFRDRTFVYFALLMLSWAFYFQFANLLLELNGVGPMDHPLFLTFPLGVSLVLVTITLFSLNYLKLSRISPVMHRYFIILLALATGGLWVPWIIGLSTRDAVYWSNVDLLLFIVSGMGMLIRCQLNGVEGANRLHLGLAFVVLPSILQTVEILLGYGVQIYNGISIQIGSVLFSWLLFSGLYTRVKEMRSDAAAISHESRLRSQFFANISHEFRTPLTLILAPLEQLSRRHADDPVDTQLINIAQRNAQRQLALVNRILTLSRLEEREDVLQLTRIDLVAKVFKIYESFVHSAEEKRIALTFAADHDELPMMADAEKLEDILFNLLSNALKFTPEGGRVGVTLSRRDDSVRIRVEDDGPGIPREMQEFIFDRFARLPDSPHTNIPGTGIGLSIVRESVELHGGKVELYSGAGEGTLFIIDLPLGDPGLERGGHPIIAEVPVQVDGPVQGEKLPRILVVEDNADLRLLLRHLLAGAFEVHEANSGKSGLEIATRLSPDLIISDVMMPGMDGIELCSKLKSRRETSHIPVILLTARGSANFRIRGLETGADDYLTKPFRDQELLARIRSLLENRKLLRKRYAESIALKPTEVAATNLDEKFLENALRIVERHIDDENFRVAKFAREIGMSSATLNRKLRGLLDQSTNQFIQSVRLQRAADLLATGEYTVGEVAGHCGFNSSTYFVRLFKEKYGVTPGNFPHQ